MVLALQGSTSRERWRCQKRTSWLCLNWKSGETVYADGRLYCLAEDGRAVLLKPTPKFKVGGSFPLVPERVHNAWAHPVLLHGRLYLRYHDTLGCYDIPAQ